MPCTVAMHWQRGQARSAKRILVTHDDWPRWHEPYPNDQVWQTIHVLKWSSLDIRHLPFKSMFHYLTACIPKFTRTTTSCKGWIHQFWLLTPCGLHAWHLLVDTSCPANCPPWSYREGWRQRLHPAYWRQTKYELKHLDNIEKRKRRETININRSSKPPELQNLSCEYNTHLAQ